MTSRCKLLILGGTGLARDFADHAAARDDIDLIYSLAGVTKSPQFPRSAEIRQGGFGGTDALKAYLSDGMFDAVVDATHPFAQQMSQSAVEACQSLALPYLSLVSPPWQQKTGDHWISATSHEDAVSKIPNGSRVLLAIGRNHAKKFLAREDCWFLVRSIEPLIGIDDAHNCLILTEKPGRSVESEASMMRNHRINLVISKNSGATQSYGKIEAARSSNIPVLMIARPDFNAPDQVFTTKEAFLWLDAKVSKFAQ